MIEASTTTALKTVKKKFIKVQPAQAKDDAENSDEYSEEDSYVYSDELGRKDTTTTGEVIFKQQC